MGEYRGGGRKILDTDWGTPGMVIFSLENRSDNHAVDDDEVEVLSVMMDRHRIMSKQSWKKEGYIFVFIYSTE
jgi:hypothetical protein